MNHDQAEEIIKTLREIREVFARLASHVAPEAPAPALEITGAPKA